ncbi:MAG: DsbA family protein [Clostridium perfringens]|nr:DsbA family protein [Clostridium perfringens]
MEVSIKVYLDYICPFCFLTRFTFGEAIKNKDVKIEYIPFEVPELNFKMDPFRKSMWNNILEGIGKRFGHKAEIPDISTPKSKLAFEAYYFANEHGKGNEFQDKVYEAFFEKGRDIGQVNVLSEIADEIGLSPADVKYALENRKYKQKKEEQLQMGKVDNIDSIPTIIIGGTKVVGYKSKEVFEDIIKEECEKLRKN